MTITSSARTAPPKQRVALRMALCLGVLIVVIWGVGFARFVEAIPRIEPATSAEADAVVVLTGGARRLGAGFRLLREGRGAHLFVSGVNGDVRPEDLRAMAARHEGIPEDTQEDARENAVEDSFPSCCVELGFEAQNTKGNAEEIAAWARERGATSLIMVTSNYHMQRAFLELRAALPEVRVLRHPVIARTVMLGTLWRWPSSLALLAGEYHKYLWAGVRTRFDG